MLFVKVRLGEGRRCMGLRRRQITVLCCWALRENKGLVCYVREEYVGR